MPAEDCAAGFAHAIVHAREYNGQVADPFRPLNSAGLLQAGRTGGAAELQEVREEREPVETALLPRATELGEELEEVLGIVQKEFEDLGFFQRSWAVRTFQ